MQPPSFFDSYKQLIDAKLAELIQQYSDSDTRLSDALSYSTILGGKRIRPILVLTAADCFELDIEKALPAACAIELIHAYSLIHDDLPAMDDDDLRRGQATCHIAFDEATAILAGDALQSMAFELLANATDALSANQLEMIKVLAKASGARGMVLGQAIDLEAVGTELNLEQLERMHGFKTGALIEASVVLGALSANVNTTDKDISHLKDYAQALGLAFQVRDDILDVISDTETLGKQQGADAALNKPTYPSLLGLDGAKAKLAALHDVALASLDKITTHETSSLREIADFVVFRDK